MTTHPAEDTDDDLDVPEYDHSARRCGVPTVASFLFGCVACQGSCDGGRAGFQRLGDCSLDIEVDAVEAEAVVRCGPSRDRVQQDPADKVDIVLRLIDNGPGPSKREFFKQHGWRIANTGGDRYTVNGRDVHLKLLPAGRPLEGFRHLEREVGFTTAKRSARIIVEDGPLRQPLLDYLLETGKNETYDRIQESFNYKPARNKLVSFNLQGVPLRGADEAAKVEAMMQATKQARFRRVTAESAMQLAKLPVMQPARRV